MDEMNDKIGAILNDPKLMQQIMTMAQSLGTSPQAPEQSKQETAPAFDLPNIDMAAMQRITGLARQSSIDKREQALLRALSAYLSKDRISRLEKAMRAAKMAKLASSALSQKGQLFPTGR